MMTFFSPKYEDEPAFSCSDGPASNTQDGGFILSNE